MSPSEPARSDWSSTTWLLLLLCLSLLGWRFNARQEQYRVSAANSSVTISAFDANERNYESAHATRSQSRAVAEALDKLHWILKRPQQQIKPVLRRNPDTWVALGLAFVDSVSLFSNPPPSFLA